MLADDSLQEEPFFIPYTRLPVILTVLAHWVYNEIVVALGIDRE